MALDRPLAVQAIQSGIMAGGTPTPRSYPPGIDQGRARITEALDYPATLWGPLCDLAGGLSATRVDRASGWAAVGFLGPITNPTRLSPPPRPWLSSASVSARLAHPRLGCPHHWREVIPPARWGYVAFGRTLTPPFRRFPPPSPKGIRKVVHFGLVTEGNGRSEVHYHQGWGGFCRHTIYPPG